MDSFELNKIAAAGLIALLGIMIAGMIGKAFVHPEKIAKNAYLVEIGQEEVGSTATQEKTLSPIEPLLAKADPANGEKIFKKCVACHTIGKGEPHKTGPNLWSIIMAPTAHAQDYAYSTVMKDLKGQWTYENLNKFLFKPRDFAAGTKMTFIGLAHDQERADLIAYLRQHADTPHPLP